MAHFDVDAAMRWARLDPRRAIAHRPDADLPFIERDGFGGQALLLDTCVCIDQLQGKSPDVVTRAIASRHASHSSVTVSELMHTIGVLDPRDGRTPAVVAEISGLIKRMPVHRVFSPDADVLGRAGLLAGVVCRLQGFGPDRRLRALLDCVLFLQAQKLGLTVLTRDVGDFDVLQQLLPGGRVLFYRRELR